MCTRFVYRGDDVITGFNFDVDPAEWDYRILRERDRFGIGILRPDGARHVYHGIHRNGNVGTLLYVHGNPDGRYRASADCVTVADLTERFIRAELSFDDACRLVRTKRIVYAPDATMQAMLSDRSGRTLVVEPGVGCRVEDGRFSLMTNGSLLAPERTRPFLLPGDDRFGRAQRRLRAFGGRFTADDALSVLQAVCQEGRWATRVSFVYEARRQTVSYVLDRRFSRVNPYGF